MEAPSCLAGQSEKCPKCGEPNLVPTFEIIQHDKIIRYLYCKDCQNINPHSIYPKELLEAQKIADIFGVVCGVIFAIVAVMKFGHTTRNSIKYWLLMIGVMIICGISYHFLCVIFYKCILWRCKVCAQRYLWKSFSKLAVCSVALGVLSFVLPFVLSIPAIICGHLGLKELKHAPHISGRRLALIGAILGYMSIIFIASIYILYDIRTSKPTTHLWKNTQVLTTTKTTTNNNSNSETIAKNTLPSDAIYSNSRGSGGNYKDSINGYFEVQPPTGFQIREIREKNKFTIEAGSSHIGEVVPKSFIQFVYEEKGFIAVIARKTFNTIEEDFEVISNELPKKYPGVMIHSSRFVTIDEAKGWEVFASWHGQKFLVVKYKKYGLDHTITINCDDADFPKFEDKFIAFLRSYRSLEPK
jgi:hypothetical protein